MYRNGDGQKGLNCHFPVCFIEKISNGGMRTLEHKAAEEQKRGQLIFV